MTNITHIRQLTERYLWNLSKTIDELSVHIDLRLEFDDITEEELGLIEQQLDNLADHLADLASGKWPKFEKPALSRSPDRKQDS